MFEEKGEKDVVIFSKGYLVLVFYVMFYEMGFFSDEEFYSFVDIDGFLSYVIRGLFFIEVFSGFFG